MPMWAVTLAYCKELKPNQGLEPGELQGLRAGQPPAAFVPILLFRSAQFGRQTVRHTWPTHLVYPVPHSFAQISWPRNRYFRGLSKSFLLLGVNRQWINPVSNRKLYFELFSHMEWARPKVELCNHPTLGLAYLF